MEVSLQAPCSAFISFKGDAFGYKEQYAVHLRLEYRAVMIADLHHPEFFVLVDSFHPVCFTLINFSSTSLSKISSSSCPCSASFATAFHHELWTSLFFVRSLDVFPENSVQLPFHFVTFVVGFVETALHLFNASFSSSLLFWSCSSSPLIIPLFFVVVFRA